MKLSKLFTEFFASERVSGFLLIGCTVCSLLLANSSFGETYKSIWDTNVLHHSITYWINDLLMAVFFLLVGLEIEREIYVGELKQPGKAMLPFIAAMGGMLVPAFVFAIVNLNTRDFSGAGIPMATDIAFALGMLSLLGNRIPTALKIFLTALAIIDDLGSIIIIAIFYSQGIHWLYLAGAAFVFLLLIFLNKKDVKDLRVYLSLGFAMWYFMLQSGVHASITGVLLAFAIPFRDGGEHSPSAKLQHFLHKPVAFFILPLFALANTCILLSSDSLSQLQTSNSMGIMLGLTLGKPIGIFSFSMLAVFFRLGSLPKSLNWKHIFGAGILGGIGFTMSIFISLLAFQNPLQIESSKIAILIASSISSVFGILWLFIVLKKQDDLQY